MTGLPWVRLDTGFAHHPKTLALIADGRWRAVVVYIAALGWAQAHATDGHIPAAALPLIHATKRDADHLVGVGLWHRSDIGGGWIINDWADYQPASEKYGNTREKSRKGNCIRWHGFSCGCWKHPPADAPKWDPNGSPIVGLHGT